MGATYPGIISDRGFDCDEAALFLFHPNVFVTAAVARAMACFISSKVISTSSSFVFSVEGSDASASSDSSSLWIGSGFFVASVSTSASDPFVAMRLRVAADDTMVQSMPGFFL